MHVIALCLDELGNTCITKNSNCRYDLIALSPQKYDLEEVLTHDLCGLLPGQTKQLHANGSLFKETFVYKHKQFEELFNLKK